MVEESFGMRPSTALHPLKYRFLSYNFIHWWITAESPWMRQSENGTWKAAYTTCDTNNDSNYRNSDFLISP